MEIPGTDISCGVRVLRVPLSNATVRCWRCGGDYGRSGSDIQPSSVMWCVVLLTVSSVIVLPGEI